MGRPRTIDHATRTTVYVIKKDVVYQHMINLGEKELKIYLNRLIREDILKNGDEYVIRKYFGKDAD